MQIGTYIRGTKYRVWKLIYTTEFWQNLQDNSIGNNDKQRDSHTGGKKKRTSKPIWHHTKINLWKILALNIKIYEALRNKLKRISYWPSGSQTYLRYGMENMDHSLSVLAQASITKYHRVGGLWCFIVLEAGSPGSGWLSSDGRLLPDLHWILTEQNRGSSGASSSSYKGTDFIMRAPPSRPHLALITIHRPQYQSH